METLELVKELLDKAKERKESVIAIASGKSVSGMAVAGNATDLATTIVHTYMENADVRDLVNGLVYLVTPVVFAKTPRLKLQVDAKILEAEDLVNGYDEKIKDTNSTDKKNPNEALAEYMMQYGFIAKD